MKRQVLRFLKSSIIGDVDFKTLSVGRGVRGEGHKRIVGTINFIVVVSICIKDIGDIYNVLTSDLWNSLHEYLYTSCARHCDEIKREAHVDVSWKQSSFSEDTDTQLNGIIAFISRC